ncbi:Maspardin [Halotydeus destructor]|nr:Maspardin [Halotydeus destructor]
MASVFNFLSGKKNKLDSVLSQTFDYQSFRSNIPQRKIVVDEDSSKVWTVYDAGPRSVSCPLVCLPPVCGTADVFFLQVSEFVKKGYRVISLEYPTYFTLREFVQGFIKLLDQLKLDKVHVFGASLGGFLAQKFVEACYQCPRIQSIILCNSFSDTTVFHYTNSAIMFWMMPSVALRKLILGDSSFLRETRDARIQDSILFMMERLQQLSQSELASRLTLNCMNCYVEPHKLNGVPMTMIDVFDRCAIGIKVKEEMYKLYPEAKRAHLKSGGNFPYLSRPEEVNMHILIHLRQFEGTSYDACDISQLDSGAIPQKATSQGDELFENL